MTYWLIWALVILGAVLWSFGGRERVDTTKRFDPETIGDDPEAYLEETEQRFDDIRPGTEKRILWANEPGTRTDLVLVYAHGFSASALETAPVPERVGQALGANLLNMRLTGHGRSGAAMATARVADWMADLDEALAIADRIGRKTVILSVSTGSTLAAMGLLTGRSDQIAAVAMISPNFQVQNRRSALLTWPGFRRWGPWILGETRSWTPQNDLHAVGWTNSYPLVATLPMAALVKATKGRDFSKITAPLLLTYSPEDQVIMPEAAVTVAHQWGGPVTEVQLTLTDQDDPSRHVIAGDALSPGQTGIMVDTIVEWVKELKL